MGKEFFPYTTLLFISELLQLSLLEKNSYAKALVTVKNLKTPKP